MDFPGEKHPATCPCDIARQKERLDQERAERRREEERLREKEREEEKREEQRRVVESKIEGKKRQFYRWTRVDIIHKGGQENTHKSIQDYKRACHGSTRA